MNILLKSAVIVEPSSKHHLKKRDILIEKGKISKIAASISSKKNIKEISLENLHVSRGWFDSSVSFGEPGFEERETIENGLNTAAISGFTAVAVNANTFPVTDAKAQIKFIKTKAEGHAVKLYPIGALTLGSKSIDLAELFDMTNEGAISFYDYKIPIENANLLKIALQYSQNFDGLVQSFPFEKSVAKNGVANEEVNSTKLGLKGIPNLSEELQIIRDLYILEYTGGKLHIPTISTKKSVSLIKEAKKNGLNVSCSVSIFNLFLTDELLEEFNTNYKLLPPLRTSEDAKALLKGLKDGTIDGVTSDHNPIDTEHKKTEFEHAKFGSIGLEACFGVLNKLIGFEKSIEALTGLREVFKIDSTKFEEGSKAELTLFNPDTEWVFSEADIYSTSKNSAFLDQKLKGKPYGILANNKLILNK
ncbi:dihydroorotase [Aequorivita echinoideorum]|uniref:Dihydroorotase n=1 Tax=Aequorivita echinoideorum TaxID=1549647 RepID=A0ABS5S6U5_9FLAO|nr:dihydroorotase [Aequorivita echinoideorum]MBT0608930.1 dihydroorotase [Aequorivita echinoideorum]